MAENLIIRQNNRFETEFFSTDPDQPDSREFKSRRTMQELNPYGMLLAGLGGCTALVLHTYAQNHEIDLREVELRLTYDRVFVEDCENCEHIDRYTEQITEEILLSGDLDEREREKLFLVSKQCPIHKMLEDGVEVRSSLVKESESEEV